MSSRDALTCDDATCLTRCHLALVSDPCHFSRDRNRTLERLAAEQPARSSGWLPFCHVTCGGAPPAHSACHPSHPGRRTAQATHPGRPGRCPHPRTNPRRRRRRRTGVLCVGEVAHPLLRNPHADPVRHLLPTRRRYLHHPLRLTRSSRPSPRQRGRESQPTTEVLIGTETRRMPSPGRDFVIIVLLIAAWPGWLSQRGRPPHCPRIPEASAGCPCRLA